MAAPTISGTVTVKVGGTEYACTASSNTLTAHIPYGSSVNEVEIKAGASAAASFYLDNTVGTESVCSVTTSAAYLQAGSPAANVKFDMTYGFKFYLTASATTTLGDSTEISDAYTIVLVADLDKVVVTNSYSVGLGNLRKFEITNFRYVAGGIDVGLADVFGVIAGQVVSGDTLVGAGSFYVDPATNKLLFFVAAGTQVSAGTKVNATLLAIKA